MKAFPRKGGIPAGSKDFTCSVCQQEGGQHGLEQKNKLKTTYTPSAAIMVDCVSWGTKEQGVPMRQHRLVHTGSQSKDSIWGHVTHTWAFHKVM